MPPRPPPFPSGDGNGARTCLSPRKDSQSSSAFTPDFPFRFGIQPKQGDEVDERRKIMKRDGELNGASGSGTASPECYRCRLGERRDRVSRDSSTIKTGAELRRPWWTSTVVICGRLRQLESCADDMVCHQR
ncbi:unnamed protein product [Urochloa humidicola]